MGDETDPASVAENRTPEERAAATATAHLAEVRELLEQRLRYDQAKEAVIDRMHAELQTLRAEQAGKSVRPLVAGVIRLFSDIDRTAVALRAGPPPDAERLIRLLESFRDQAEAVLAHEGIDAFRVEGESFDGRRQQVVARRPADTADQVGRVAEHVRPGFSSPHFLFEREAVAVWIAAPSTRPPEPPAGPEAPPPEVAASEASSAEAEPAPAPTPTHAPAEPSNASERPIQEPNP